MEQIKKKPAEEEMPFAVANILTSYVNGFYDLNQANVALKACGASFRIIEGENSLSQEEKDEVSIAGGPDTVTGWGLVESSDGKLRKVFCENGTLRDFASPMNSPVVSYFLIANRIYRVQGDLIANL